MVRFSTFMLSCSERQTVRRDTLMRLQEVEWPSPVVIMDDGVGATRIDRIHRTWRRVIQAAARATTECVLLLEDDLVFCRWFKDNLLSWPIIHGVPPGGALYASLYNPNRPFIIRRVSERYVVAYPDSLWGSQAIVMTPKMAAYIDANWQSATGNPDQRMPRLAARVTPIYIHVPSLVNHAPVPTTWGGMEHSASDFEMDWRVESLPIVCE